jgi:hypothetical protein
MSIEPDEVFERNGRRLGLALIVLSALLWVWVFFAFERVVLHGN